MAIGLRRYRVVFWKKEGSQKKSINRPTHKLAIESGIRISLEHDIERCEVQLRNRPLNVIKNGKVEDTVLHT